MSCTQLLEAGELLRDPEPVTNEMEQSTCAPSSCLHGSDAGSESKLARLPALLRLQIREARLRFYDAELQTPEGWSELMGEIEFLKDQYRELSGDESIADSPTRQQFDRQLNLAHFGCEKEDTRQSEYDEAICLEADLSELQARVLILSLEGKTREEIAWRLKRSQRAVERALETARDKFLSAQRKAGGPHLSDRFRLIHYSDTHGYTDWGRSFEKQHGHFPDHCRRCQ